MPSTRPRSFSLFRCSSRTTQDRCPRLCLGLTAARPPHNKTQEPQRVPCFCLWPRMQKRTTCSFLAAALRPLVPGGAPLSTPQGPGKPAHEDVEPVSQGRGDTRNHSLHRSQGRLTSKQGKAPAWSLRRSPDLHRPQSTEEVNQKKGVVN